MNAQTVAADAMWIIWYADGTSEGSASPSPCTLTDGELRRRGIVSIDRWSPALEDYVEVRRTP